MDDFLLVGDEYGFSINVQEWIVKFESLPKLADFLYLPYNVNVIHLCE
jgi:hypothetical protein